MKTGFYYRVFESICGAFLRDKIKLKQSLTFERKDIEESFDIRVCHFFYLIVAGLIVSVFMPAYVFYASVCVIVYSLYFVYWSKVNNVRGVKPNSKKETKNDKEQ